MELLSLRSYSIHLRYVPANKLPLTFTQFAYTTLAGRYYSLVANNLIPSIMKATKIDCITLNYPSEGSMLIEFTDGSSLMIPKGTDFEVIELAFGITGRFIQAKEMFNL